MSKIRIETYKMPDNDNPTFHGLSAFDDATNRFICHGPLNGIRHDRTISLPLAITQITVKVDGTIILHRSHRHTNCLTITPLRRGNGNTVIRSNHALLFPLVSPISGMVHGRART